MCFFSACCAQEELIQVLDTRGDFVWRTESVEVELNEAILAEDSKGNLPEKFTICAATFLANWKLELRNVTDMAEYICVKILEGWGKK